MLFVCVFRLGDVIVDVSVARLLLNSTAYVPPRRPIWVSVGLAVSRVESMLAHGGAPQLASTRSLLFCVCAEQQQKHSKMRKVTCASVQPRGSRTCTYFCIRCE